MRCMFCFIPLPLALWPAIANAQSLTIDLGGAGQAGATGRLVQITALVTVLSLAPSLLVMVTAFTRIVIVLSLLRSALATQGTPPNMRADRPRAVSHLLRHAAGAGGSPGPRVFCRSPNGASASLKVCAWPSSRSIIS